MSHLEGTGSLSPDEFDFDHKVKLGNGSFGTAYKIPWRNKDYCVKCIPLKGIDPFDSIFLHLFIYYYNRKEFENVQKESAILQTIDGTHVIHYYGSFVHNDEYCIVTEFATSGDLRKVIEVCVTE